MAYLGSTTTTETVDLHPVIVARAENFDAMVADVVEVELAEAK